MDRTGKMYRANRNGFGFRPVLRIGWGDLQWKVDTLQILEIFL